MLHACARLCCATRCRQPLLYVAFFTTLFHHVDKLVLRMDIQFAIDMRDMGFGSASRYAQLVLNIAGIVVFSQKEQHFGFSAREQIPVRYFLAAFGEPSLFSILIVGCTVICGEEGAVFHRACLKGRFSTRITMHRCGNSLRFLILVIFVFL